MTQDQLKALLDYDPETGIFRWRFAPKRGTPAGAIAGRHRADGYRIIGYDRQRYYAHRLAFLWMTGRMPKYVDHIDGDPSNNRWSNLREATHKANMQNLKGAKRHSQTGVLGVIRRGKRFRAYINVDRKQSWLGTFDTVEEAGAAHLEAKRRMHEGNTL